ncbi:MAG TPA: sensor histidine kinase [Verrucomicrobiae bacterium]|jgi:signal transduction histidine kinase|nr:sensor histidine kinase [Verrucomicrobiae bacterium]
MIKRITFIALAVWAGFACERLSAQTPITNRSSEIFTVQSVYVNDKQMPLRRNSVNLGAYPEHISFYFPRGTNSSQQPIRVRFKLEGYDTKWHDSRGDMTLTIRYFNRAGDQVSQNIFNVTGDSPGWTGSLQTSQLNHRRETLVMPPKAATLRAVISSAGPATAVGVYVVANLTISQITTNSQPVLILATPSDLDLNEETNPTLSGWIRDGLHKSMAKIVTVGENPKHKAFAILDDDPTSHAEWRNIFRNDEHVVTPGDRLVVEWDEMYSIGDGNVTAAHYDHLPEGNYQLHVAEDDIFGKPTGREGFLNVVVPPPFWMTAWFGVIVTASVFAIVLGSARYRVWRRIRREMLHLKNQEALHRERLRIAQDIHDDLGARVTQISLLSAMAPNRASFPEQARADFDKISRVSRELIFALYETVWAVNPEKDNLEALGSYLCQQLDELCKLTHLRGRFYVLDLPSDVNISSQVRHNIYMAAKEAVINVMKHAGASEVTVHMAFVNGLLTLSIHDDGCGIPASGSRAGNGLVNIKRRLEDVGGNCVIESRPGFGTTIRIELVISSFNSSNDKTIRLSPIQKIAAEKSVNKS